jgi:hypothetical protein
MAVNRSCSENLNGHMRDARNIKLSSYLPFVQKARWFSGIVICHGVCTDIGDLPSRKLRLYDLVVYFHSLLIWLV